MLSRAWALGLRPRSRVTASAQSGLIPPARLIHQRVALEIRVPLQKSHNLQRQHHDDSRHYRGRVEPRAASHTDGSHNPDARGTGKAADPAAIVQDETRAQKADALNDVGRHLAFVWTGVAGQHR